MKLHTKLDIGDVYNSLLVTKARGLMTEDIILSDFQESTSKTHAHGFNIALATTDKHSGPTNSRHYKNPSKKGPRYDRLWAATWDEWGWFIADIFDRDPDAKFSTSSGPRYKNRDHFHEVTNYKYRDIPNGGLWVNTIHP